MSRCAALFTVVVAAAALAAPAAAAGGEEGAKAAATSPADERPALPKGPRPFKIFDGKPKALVLLTSSHRGGGELFPRVRKMRGGEKVLCRQQGYDTDEDGRRRFPSALPPKPDELPDYCPRQELKGTDPVIFLVLSGAVRAKDFPPVPGTCTEKEAIRRGVQIMCEGARRAEDKGVDWVLLSTMHYNPNLAWPHCVGWEQAGKLVAAYNKTEVGKRHPAVDVWEPLRPFYPEYYSGDLYHCNGYGRQLVAHYWFKALCEWDGIEVPAWSWEMVEAAKKREMAGRAGIRDVRGKEVLWPEGASGRALEATWQASADLKDFAAESYRCEQYYAARGGASGSGRFYGLAGAEVTRDKNGWKLIWPLPASDEPKGQFRSGDHYFIKVKSGNQWNVSPPVKLGPGGDLAPWTKRP